MPWTIKAEPGNVRLSAMNEQDEMTAHVPEGWQPLTDARRAQLKTHYELRALGRRRAKRLALSIAMPVAALIIAAFCFESTRPLAPLLILAASVFCIWRLPGFIANLRRHRNALGIWLLTIFLGWTLVGWVGALVWAVYEEKK